MLALTVVMGLYKHFPPSPGFAQKGWNLSIVLLMSISN